MTKGASLSGADQAARNRFAETRWSLVAGLNMGEPERQRCLAELCRTYYFPVYAHIRRQGHPEDQAYEFTLAFFGNLIANLDQARPEGRFRTFLLAQLEGFLAEPNKPTEASRALDGPTRAALEARFGGAGDAARDLSHAFDSDYAREVMARSLNRLRSEAEQNGRLEMYIQLAPFLTREPMPDQFQELSATLSLSRITLVVALKRLRARFNELVNRELSETVHNPADLESERQTLYNVLRGNDT